MRLTPNILLDAPSFLNPEHQRTLSLRGLKIPMVENFYVTKDVNEAIDLTDNDIKILGNFPILLRVKTLLLARNRIQSIQDDFTTSVPFLETLSLVSNSISLLSSLRPLQNCKRLHSLYLVNNPVTNQENYRLFVIWLIPQLKVLDFQKIKDQERSKGHELFGESLEEPTDLALKILKENAHLQNTVDLEDKDEAQIKDVLKKLTQEDREKLKEELKTATSLAEIDRIETALKSGYI